MIELMTERLSLQRLGAADLDDLWRLHSDPRVMRYLGGTPATDPDAHRRRVLSALDDYADSALGYWSIRRLEDDVFLGLARLKPVDDVAEAEIGYRLLPEEWGRGVATEAGRALLRYAFQTLRIERVIGLAHPEDVVSKRVLEKLGLEPRGAVERRGARMDLYVLDRPRAAGAPERVPVDASASDPPGSVGWS